MQWNWQIWKYILPKKEIKNTEIEQDEIVTQWDDYNCEILPNKFGTGYLTVKNQIINR